jgi:hypothetical protein
MSTSEIVTRVAGIDVSEGDTVVLEAPYHMTSDQVARIVEHAGSALPAGVKVLVLCSGVVMSKVVKAPTRGTLTLDVDCSGLDEMERRIKAMAHQLAGMKAGI